MRTTKCIECGKVIEQTGNNHKYCASCRAKRELEYKKSHKGRKVKRKWSRSLRGRKLLCEADWRKQGIVGITYEIWKQDSRKGCRFKFLGGCGGILGADHDHETGEYRIPLCLRHNMALAALGDVPEKLKEVIRILESK